MTPAKTAELGQQTAPDPAGGMAPTQADFLLETIVCGAYESAIQAAAFANVLNVCAQTGDASRILAFRHILLDDSEVMLFALSYSEDIRLGRRAVASLQTLYREMAGAKRSLAPLMQYRGARTVDRGVARNAAHSWRRIAEAATKAIEQLQDVVRARLHATYERDARKVIGFLRQAVNGDVTVFDAEGALILPALEQRRRVPRFPVSQACTIVSSSGAHRAQLADVSKQGLAIVCDVTPAVGETITVELADGRKLAATVVRTQGAKVGLRLANSLAMSDPLFASGAG